MLKASSAEVKQMAKNRLSGNWGSALIAVFIPLLIAIVVGIIVGLVFLAAPIVSTIASTLVTAVTSFMILRMIIPFAKGKEQVDFGSSFGPGQWLTQFMLYSLIIFAVTLIVNIPVNLAFYGEPFVFGADAEVQVNTSGQLFDTAQISSMVYSLVTSVVLWLITLKLYFTQNLIADKGLSAVDAMKTSWNLTSGNLGRLIYFQLSWIGWYLLSVLTCGLLLFYVLPYHMTADAFLYLEVLDENGESDYNPHSKQDAHLQGDWVEVQEQETPEEEKDSWDF